MRQEQAAVESGAIWLDREPEERADAVKHVHSFFRQLDDGSRLLGASVRGKKHAHYGQYREDAIALGERRGWVVGVLADGAGSRSLSRVGARAAARSARECLFSRLDRCPDIGADGLRAAIVRAMENARFAVERTAEHRRLDARQLASTLLMFVVGKSHDVYLIGVGQIGDGLVGFLDETGLHRPLLPQVGSFANETEFITDTVSTDDWRERSAVETVSAQPHIIFGMTDGIADDLYRYPSATEGFIRDLVQKVTDTAKPGPALAREINYDLRGSFDDRSVALLVSSGQAP